MKIRERFLKTFTFGVLLFILMLCGTTAMAAGETHLSSTEKELALGKSFILTLKNNTKPVKWSTPRSSIVSLKKLSRNKVRLTAKSLGGVSISATVGNETYRCWVRVLKHKNRVDNPAKSFLQKQYVKAGSKQISLKDCSFAYQDFNRDGAKELIIRPKSNLGYGLGKTYFFRKKGTKFKYIGSIPTGGTRQFVGYSSKTGLPYMFTASYYYDSMGITLYKLKKGKATVKISLGVSDGKYWVNNKSVSYASFKRTYNKYLNGPLPVPNKSWEGGNTFDFRTNQY